MAAALADKLGDLVLAVVVLIGESVITERFFHRVQIGSLHVLDDRNFERDAVARINRDDRHIVQTGALRCAPSPLAGNDLETILRALHRTHNNRLDHAMLLDRFR